MKGKPAKNPNHPLYRLFLERGIDKDTFAEAVGISRRWLDMILQGSQRPGSKLALKMSRLLGVPLEEVLFPKLKEEKSRTGEETPRPKRRAKA